MTPKLGQMIILLNPFVDEREVVDKGFVTEIDIPSQTMVCVTGKMGLQQIYFDNEHIEYVQ